MNFNVSGIRPQLEEANQKNMHCGFDWFLVVRRTALMVLLHKQQKYCGTCVQSHSAQ